ncbi:MAG: tRNA (adenosine(37)-N6)-threonylcarbamoyltransferase complex dimerization subunit type 1 TsaB [Acidobacteria bacterium]|nr:tRNA (adenosine(37)-N6)-threonylcarbamoyltransferase complex dimerization subunit type 1 TsaB [Acidobacteriota bacterium]
MLASTQPPLMRVLSLDSASPGPALAVADEAGRGPVTALPAAAAEAIPNAVAAALAGAGLAVADLDRVAVLSGPGSFTGLRAGMAFARGLARARGIPLVLVPTFRAASSALPEPADVLFVLDAGRGEVHAARRGAGRLAEEPAPRPREEVLAAAAAAGVPVVDLALAGLPLASAAARVAAAAGPEFSGGIVYGRRSAAEEKLGVP